MNEGLVKSKCGKTRIEQRPEQLTSIVAVKRNIEGDQLVLAQGRTAHAGVMDDAPVARVEPDRPTELIAGGLQPIHGDLVVAQLATARTGQIRLIRWKVLPRPVFGIDLAVMGDDLH